MHLHGSNTTSAWVQGFGNTWQSEMKDVGLQEFKGTGPSKK